MNIPAFTGKENTDAYYEWETKVDQIFDLYGYPAEKKAKLAAIEFRGCAITGGIKYVQNSIVWDMIISLGKT